MKKSELTLYDMAKMISKTTPALDIIQINRLISIVAEDISKYKYAMLLCRERYDFTLFNISTLTYDTLVKELSYAIRNRGEEILHIDKQNDGAWEIWIRDNNECYAYYLFDYSDAVIE